MSSLSSVGTHDRCRMHVVEYPNTDLDYGELTEGELVCYNLPLPADPREETGTDSPELRASSVPCP